MGMPPTVADRLDVVLLKNMFVLYVMRISVLPVKIANEWLLHRNAVHPPC